MSKMILIIVFCMGSLFLTSIMHVKNPLTELVLILGGTIYLLGSLNDVKNGMFAMIALLRFPFKMDEINKKTLDFNKEYFPLKIKYKINSDLIISDILILNDKREVGKKEIKINPNKSENNLKIFLRLKVRSESILFN